jgi:hypothetical protein
MKTNEELIERLKRRAATHYGIGFGAHAQTLLDDINEVIGVLEALQPSGDVVSVARGDFEKDMASLINRYSLEGGSDTPDFILATYLRHCLMAFNAATVDRDRWYEPTLSQPSTVSDGKEG